MKPSRLVLVIILSLFAFHAATAQDTFVCGQTLVETGLSTTKEEVQEKCGPPSVKTSDRWYYKDQPGQVTVVLTFENGMRQQIENIPQE